MIVGNIGFGLRDSSIFHGIGPKLSFGDILKPENVAESMIVHGSTRPERNRTRSD